MERDGEAHYNDGISLRMKALGYTFVFGVNACMLFYVFLFALRQTKARQDAWFRSFLIWLGLDTILVCTLVVLVSNIVIPTYITKYLSKLKERLVSTFRAYVLLGPVAVTGSLVIVRMTRRVKELMETPVVSSILRTSSSCRTESPAWQSSSNFPQHLWSRRSSPSGQNSRISR